MSVQMVKCDNCGERRPFNEVEHNYMGRAECPVCGGEMG